MGKVFRIEFTGLWMGGMAVIQAENQDEAMAILKEAHMSNKLNPEKHQVRSIEEVQPPILYYWDGDY